jgi:hypothetical protein
MLKARMGSIHNVTDSLNLASRQLSESWEEKKNNNKSFKLYLCNGFYISIVRGSITVHP